LLGRKTPDFTLKKKQGNNKKTPDIQNVLKKSKSNLKCMLLVLAHKNLGNMHYLHQIFNKFRSILKHNANLQVD